MPSIFGHIGSRLSRACLLLTLPALAAAFPVGAQQYPIKPIRVIVPYGAGGAGDVAFRLIANQLEAKLGQRFVVEFKPGASGNIGAAEVARAEPDGYTLLVGGGNNFSSNQFLYDNMGFDPLKAFDPIALLTNSPTIVTVNLSVSANSLSELIAYANANPGKLNFGSPGVGTPPHLAGELFASLAGIRMVHVPFNSSPQVMIALQQNSVQVAFYTMGPIGALIRGGEAKPLAVAAPSRLIELAQVPTSKESGFPTLLTGSQQLLVAPRGTDPRILDRLNTLVREAIAAPNVQDRFAKMGAVGGDLSRAELEAFLREEAARWKNVVETAGIQRK